MPVKCAARWRDRGCRVALPRHAAQALGRRSVPFTDVVEHRMASRVPSAHSYTNEAVRHPPLTVVDVVAEATAVTEAYRNQVLCKVNTSCLRLAVINDQYPWHRHPRSDELFLVVEGRLEIEVAGGETLYLGPWQSAVIPAGVIHRTRGVGRTVNLCFEDLAAETEFVEASQ
jgi:mannose-6-phosphate isomerase-like protein (cupin superfamily)